MTTKDFKSILDKAKGLYEKGRKLYVLNDLREDSGMWNFVTGDMDGDPSIIYDMFLGAFVLSRTMDKIPWNENVHVFDGWRDKKDKGQGLASNSILAESKDGERTIAYRFSANSCIDGKFGLVPLKKENGWRFEIEFRRGPDSINGTLRVFYKGKEEQLTEQWATIQQCQFALICFLKAAREVLTEK